MSEYILTYDLGTTGLKVVLFKDTGEVVSSVYQEYTTYYPNSGWAEQDPKEWWQAVCNSTKKIIDKTRISPNRIACVSLTGQYPSTVLVDESGNLTRRYAIIWTDIRSEKQAKSVIEKLGFEKIYSTTANGDTLETFPYTKIMWIRENEPSILGKTYKIMQAKDYIILRLTGEFVADFSGVLYTGMLNVRRREWFEEVLEIAGISKGMLPELHESTDVAGHITEEASKETSLDAGTTVVIGGGDVPCATAGSGAVERGIWYIYIGSAAWVGIATKELLLDQETRLTCGYHIVPGMYSPYHYSSDGGVCYRWIRNNFCDAEVDVAEKEGVNVYELMDSKASSVQPGANNLFFQPYMRGLGPPHNNINDRGAFIGLRLAHKKEHALRSVLEGTTYRIREIVELLEQKGGDAEEIRLVGGGAKSKLWGQIISDILGKEIIYPSSFMEVSSMGAAMAGGVGMRIFKDFKEAKNMVKIIATLHPRPKIHEKYNKIFNIYKEIYKSLRLPNDMIAEIEKTS